VNSGERSLIEFLADEAETRDVRFLLIGGWALEAYGFARQTVDLDCLVADPDSPKLDSFLRAAGFTQIAQTENFRRYRHADFGYLDVLLVDVTTFEKIYAASQPFRVGRVVLKVPSLPHFIALKLHATKNAPAREMRELADIEQIARHGQIAKDEMEQLCAQFGPPNIWTKLSKQLYGNE
jgi:Nucleotidyl transferase AbiEii toxin, Type IV TA system